MGTTAFEVIVKQQIKRLEEPSLKCINMIYDELVRILSQLLMKQSFRRFPNLREKFQTVIIAFYKKMLPSVQKLITDLIMAEATYVNTAHPDFITGHQAMSLASEKIMPKPVNPQETQQNGRGSTSSRSQSTSNVSPLSNQRNLLNEEKDDGFFSSFWPSKKKDKKTTLEAPPTILKASGHLSERELLEMETISKFSGHVAC